MSDDIEFTDLKTANEYFNATNRLVKNLRERIQQLEDKEFTSDELDYIFFNLKETSSIFRQMQAKIAKIRGYDFAREFGEKEHCDCSECNEFIEMSPIQFRLLVKNFVIKKSEIEISYLEDMRSPDWREFIFQGRYGGYIKDEKAFISLSFFKSQFLEKVSKDKFYTIVDAWHRLVREGIMRPIKITDHNGIVKYESNETVFGIQQGDKYFLLKELL